MTKQVINVKDMFNYYQTLGWEELQIEDIEAIQGIILTEDGHEEQIQDLYELYLKSYERYKDKGTIIGRLRIEVRNIQIWERLKLKGFIRESVDSKNEEKYYNDGHMVSMYEKTLNKYLTSGFGIESRKILEVYELYKEITGRIMCVRDDYVPNNEGLRKYAIKEFRDRTNTHGVNFKRNYLSDRIYIELEDTINSINKQGYEKWDKDEILKGLYKGMKNFITYRSLVYREGA